MALGRNARRNARPLLSGRPALSLDRDRASSHPPLGVTETPPPARLSCLPPPARPHTQRSALPGRQEPARHSGGRWGGTQPGSGETAAAPRARSRSRRRWHGEGGRARGVHGSARTLPRPSPRPRRLRALTGRSRRRIPLAPRAASRPAHVTRRPSRELRVAGARRPASAGAGGSPAGPRHRSGRAAIAGTALDGGDGAAAAAAGRGRDGASSPRAAPGPPGPCGAAAPPAGGKARGVSRRRAEPPVPSPPARPLRPAGIRPAVFPSPLLREGQPGTGASPAERRGGGRGLQHLRRG